GDQLRRGSASDEQSEGDAENRKYESLRRLLPNEPAPARAQRCAQGELPFPLDDSREQQACEIRCRNQERAGRRANNDKELRPQIHNEALAQRRDIGRANSFRIWIMAVYYRTHP